MHCWVGEDKGEQKRTFNKYIGESGRQQADYEEIQYTLLEMV